MTFLALVSATSAMSLALSCCVRPARDPRFRPNSRWDTVCSHRRMLNHSRIVYVLRSVKHPDRYYTGLTDNVERRLAVHNSGGSLHTASLRPWSVVAFTEFANPESAAAFEQHPKTGSRRAFSKRHYVQSALIPDTWVTHFHRVGPSADKGSTSSSPVRAAMPA